MEETTTRTIDITPLMTLEGAKHLIGMFTDSIDIRRQHIQDAEEVRTFLAGGRLAVLENNWELETALDVAIDNYIERQEESIASLQSGIDEVTRAIEAATLVIAR